jgi:hypothetical protein
MTAVSANDSMICRRSPWLFAPEAEITWGFYPTALKALISLIP